MDGSRPHAWWRSVKARTVQGSRSAAAPGLWIRLGDRLALALVAPFAKCLPVCLAPVSHLSEDLLVHVWGPGTASECLGLEKTGSECYRRHPSCHRQTLVILDRAPTSFLCRQWKTAGISRVCELRPDFISDTISGEASSLIILKPRESQVSGFGKKDS